MKKLLTAILSFLLSVSAYGQNSSAAIAGKVTDQNGAAISGANVKIKNNAGETKTTTTDSNGEFSFSNSADESYRLTVEKSGFEVFSQQVADGSANLVISLKVADVGAIVEVQDENYAVEESTTATKINAPLRDIPQSIQVVNQNILRDRATFNFAEAVTQNVSGVTRHTTDLTGSGAGDFLRLRGFSGSYNNSYLRNGLKFPNYGATETADVDRIEVLKGTSSVLYGRAEPGGVVNLVTKEPTNNNFFSAELTGGQFNFYRPQIDAGGKIFGSEKLSYRFNAAYQYDGNFRDDGDGRRFVVAPVVLWKPLERLQITFDVNYLREIRGMDVGQILVNGRPADVDPERSYGEPFNRAFQQNRSGGVRGRYDFNANWSVQTAYRTQFFDYSLFGAFPAIFIVPPVQADDRTVNRDFASTDYTERWHYSDSNFNGKFATGRIKHNILAGFEFGYTNGIYNHDYLAAFLGAFAFPTTDIFNQTAPRNYEFAQQFIRSVQAFIFPSQFRNRLKSNAVYAQDLITITPQFKVLIGARYDNYQQRFVDLSQAIQRSTDNRFSPRIGFVYQPREFVSFYASYGSSFSPQFPNQLGFDNRPFKPSTGEQLETGVKFDGYDGKINATLAFYNLKFKDLIVSDLKFKDLIVSDPNRPGFSIQTGEQSSRGIELDVAASPLRGLNLTGNYAATQAIITKDTDALLVGRFLPNTARHNGNLWATYRFVEASSFLKNLGIGAGVQATGERFTNLANFGQMPGFARIDATAFYDFNANEKTRMRFAVNLQNLTNKRYYESAFGFNDTVYPGAPLRALFSLKITRR